MKFFNSAFFSCLFSSQSLFYFLRSLRFLSHVLGILLLGSWSLFAAHPLSSSEKEMLQSQYVELPSKPILAENFSGMMNDGKTRKLSDYKGKWVFLNFWATWCLPCLKEMPDMEVLLQKFEKDGFVILAVGMGESIEKAKAFLKKHSFSFPVMEDPDGEISQLYGVSAIPVTFLITPEGKIIARAVGPRTWANPKFMKFFEQRLQE